MLSWKTNSGIVLLVTLFVPHLGKTDTRKASKHKIQAGVVDKDRIFNHSSIMFLIKQDATKLHRKQISEIGQRMREGNRLKAKFEEDAPKMPQEEKEKESVRINEFMEKFSEDKKDLEE